MNVRNVKGIKVKHEDRDLIYEVVFFTRINDLRSPGVYGDKRKAGNNIGDGWNDETNQRHLLNDNVDSFIKQLDRNGRKYTLLFDKDMENLK